MSYHSYYLFGPRYTYYDFLADFTQLLHLLIIFRVLTYLLLYQQRKICLSSYTFLVCCFGENNDSSCMQISHLTNMVACFFLLAADISDKSRNLTKPRIVMTV